MDGNYIKDLPKDVFSSIGLSHLHKISLRDCNIQTIHENSFSGLKILNEINLQGNNLTVLPPQAFQGNDGLRILLLGSNNISKLKAHQFPPLRNLRKIDLSNNALVSVDRLAFQNLAQSSIEEVNLAQNKLRRMSETTFLSLTSLKHLQLHSNPWLCDCQLKSFRDLVVHRALSTGLTICAEPVRLADKPWDKVNSQEFACKPEVSVRAPTVFASPGQNATLECHILGNPVPAVKWVLNGRVIQNRSTPLQCSNCGQIYVINSVATSEGGIERNFSLTITNVIARDLGKYSCVAINAGGVSEREVMLTFDDPTGPGGAKIFDEKQLAMIIGVGAGMALILLVIGIVCCCRCRRQRKDKPGHSPDGSVLGYTDPANEKLLPQNGSLHRPNPVPKPHRTGQYGGNINTEQEMLDYGPASYVPGDRYDELGEGRTSASNSDQTGTLSRASYHSSDPDQYPDLLDIPNRYKQPSPTSTTSTLYDTAKLPHHTTHHLPHHHPHHLQQPLHPAHLVSPPHLHHHHASPFQRPGQGNLAYSSGSLPHPHHPRSVSCDHTTGSSPAYLPVQQTTHQARPGYVTLPRRPRTSWAGQGPARDTPSPAFSLRDQRDPVYDGVGPRTSADGSSHRDLNKSVDSTGSSLPRGAKYGGTGAGHPSLIPYCPPIEEECPQTPKLPQTVHFNGVPSQDQDKPKSTTNPQASCGSLVTLGGLEENLSAYFEPFGAALAPVSPGARDSIASNESDSALLLPRSANDSEATAPSSLPSIPEQESVPLVPVLKKPPPPTLPKPPKKPGKEAPVPPPKPKTTPSLENKTKSESFQDETCDGSEV